MLELSPVAVNELGAKEQVVFAGKPKQLKKSVPAYPLTGLIVTVAVPVRPCLTVIVVGFAVIEKSGGAVIVSIKTLEVELRKLLSPPYVAEMEWDPTPRLLVVY
jgi:hypothetical protein